MNLHAATATAAPLLAQEPRPAYPAGWGHPLLAAHDLVAQGIRTEQVMALLARYKSVPTADLLRVLGVSERTLQRRARSKTGLLDVHVSDGAMRLASVTQQAVDVLGTQEEAERWLCQPAMALDGRRPIDLLQSSDGTGMVRTLLSRLLHGVYV